MYTDHKRVSVDGKMVVSKLPGEPGFKTLSVEELMSLPLDPSKFILRPIVDPAKANYIPPVWPSEALGKKITESYFKYRALASTRRFSSPKLNGWLDRFRWKLHLSLLRWKVIV